MLIAAVVQILLIALNAVFAGAEIAVISVNETKMKKMAEEGDKRAKRLLSLTTDQSKVLSTIQVAITLAGLLGSAFAADSFAEPLAQAIIGLGVTSAGGQSAINILCVILITIILAFFNIVFGEIIPKRMAMRRAEKMALGISGVLKAVSVVFAPFVWLLTVTSNGILRLFGIKPGEEDNPVTEEEIVLMAEAGSEAGHIAESEAELVQNVFDFKDKTAGEACTHRKDVVAVFTGETDKEWEETIYGTRHGYYPVCGEDMDEVVGMLDTRVYFRMQDKSRENVMKQAVRPVFFVHESMPANTLFFKMQKAREHVAIVLDEFGGMDGIITIRDLLELLVGDMTDKDEQDEYSVKRIEGGWELSGLVPIEEAEEKTGITFNEEYKEGCETVSGYVCNVLGYVPADGNTAQAQDGDIKIEVTKVEQHRIVGVILRQEKSGVDEKENSEYNKEGQGKDADDAEDKK